MAGLALLVAIGAASSGCSPTRSAPVGGPVRSQVAHEVLASLDRSGIPVDYDQVTCSDPDPTGLVTCLAITAYAPPNEITASFRVHRRPGGCPGRLTILVDGSPLATTTPNPCR